MSDGHVYGTRASTWVTVQRCLVILRRLQRGPASRDDLVHAVEAVVGESAYGTAPEKALGRDIQKLREVFDLTIQSRQGVYRLMAVGAMPLLDVSDEALKGVAFLYDTFKPDAPGAEDVRGLLDTLMSYLPEERREALRSLRAMPRLDLQPVDAGEIDVETWDTIERAVVRRRELAFDYLSPRREEPTHHVVAPYILDFEDGHYYLDAHCLRWKGPDGESRPETHIDYRVDRIVAGSARVLPTKLPPGRRPSRTYTLRYELAPIIVRGGVSRRFPETEVTIRQDGWAEVTAQISDPFMAAKRLLTYGAGCRVLGPAEVVHHMEEAAQGLAEIYGAVG